MLDCSLFSCSDQLHGNMWNSVPGNAWLGFVTLKTVHGDCVHGMGDGEVNFSGSIGDCRGCGTQSQAMHGLDL